MTSEKAVGGYHFNSLYLKGYIGILGTVRSNVSCVMATLHVLLLRSLKKRDLYSTVLHDPYSILKHWIGQPMLGIDKFC